MSEKPQIADVDVVVAVDESGAGESCVYADEEEAEVGGMSRRLPSSDVVDSSCPGEATAAAAAPTSAGAPSAAAEPPNIRAAEWEVMEQERSRALEGYELCIGDPYLASPESKYERYTVTVDHEHGDRATQIRLCSVARPHMRAFHCAWFSFFLAFCIWFAPAPLLKEIQDDLGLSKKEVWTSSITNDITAIVLRVIMGPLCDRYGARFPMAAILVLASIPTAMVGLVHDAVGLAVVRLFIGIAGSSFVVSQVWPSRMFAREISGTANGMVGGWGNLGGAFTQLVMGTILFPAFRSYYDGDGEKSWRIICVIPASVAFVWGLILPFVSDDAPMGNYHKMRKKGSMDRVFMTTSLRNGATRNTWILYVQYACCFGVELVMNNAAVLYYTSEFGLETEEAAALGFIYGSMNLFARGLGGFISDRLNLQMGMRGRLWLMFILLLCEGITILIFAYTPSLHMSILVMCIFSLFTQSAEGAIFGIVPYVSKLYTGSVSGIVGSGGNAGSVVYGLGFRSLDYRDAFVMMGSIVIAASGLNFFIKIPLHAGMIYGEDNFTVIQARERFIRRQQLEQIFRDGGDGGEGATREAAAEEEEEGGDRPITDGRETHNTTSVNPTHPQGGGDDNNNNTEEMASHHATTLPPPPRTVVAPTEVTTATITGYTGGDGHHDHHDEVSSLGDAHHSM